MTIRRPCFASVRVVFAPLVAMLAAAAPGGVARAQTSALSAAEQIYAGLDALSPAERTARLEQGARKEGHLTVIQTLRGELGNGQIDLFRKRYPFIDVESSADLASPEAAERLYAEEVSGRHLTDAINVAVIDLPELLEHNFLARYKSPAAKAVLPQYQPHADPQNRWTLSFWSDRGMSYNSDLVPPDQAPHGWMDLCKPFFKGSVSFESMQTRFLVGLYAILGDQTYDFFRCMGANDPIIQGNPSERVSLMLAGDHMVVADSYLYAGVAEKRKNPAAPDAIATPGPIIASFGAVALNRNTPHPYAAALFADYMLSDEEQKYLVSRLRAPVTMKHPYLPDDAQLVTTPTSVPKDVLERLTAAWLQDVEKKR